MNDEYIKQLNDIITQATPGQQAKILAVAEVLANGTQEEKTTLYSYIDHRDMKRINAIIKRYIPEVTRRLKEQAPAIAEGVK